MVTSCIARKANGEACSFCLRLEYPIDMFRGGSLFGPWLRGGSIFVALEDEVFLIFGRSLRQEGGPLCRTIDAE
jgi:hypothetical protein